MGQGISALGTEAGRGAFMSGVGGMKGLGISGLAATAPMLLGGDSETPPLAKTPPMNRLAYEPNVTTPFPQSTVPAYGDLGRDFGREQQYFSGRYVDTGVPFRPGAYAAGGPIDKPVEAYPMSYIDAAEYSRGLNLPMPQMASGGISNLGDYSDGGRLLRGPGDGVSDSIPATIGGKQPARLADGEFVVPARIVSERLVASSPHGLPMVSLLCLRVSFPSLGMGLLKQALKSFTLCWTEFRQRVVKPSAKAKLPRTAKLKTCCPHEDSSGRTWASASCLAVG